MTVVGSSTTSVFPKWLYPGTTSTTKQIFRLPLQPRPVVLFTEVGCTPLIRISEKGVEFKRGALLVLVPRNTGQRRNRDSFGMAVSVVTATPLNSPPFFRHPEPKGHATTRSSKIGSWFSKTAFEKVQDGFSEGVLQQALEDERVLSKGLKKGLLRGH